MKRKLSDEEIAFLNCLSPEIGYIGRMTCGGYNSWLYISKGKNYHEWSPLYIKGSLFIFIKEEEEYSIQELLEENQNGNKNK